MKEIPEPPSPEELELEELPKAEHIIAPPPEVAKVEPVELPVEPEEPKSEKFVEKNAYESVVAEMANAEASLHKTQATMDDLIALKTEADTKIDEWRASLEDVERKLLYIDKVLFEK